MHEEGVEPTNNAAERALRTAVQWRKIMFSNRSEDGERAVARLLTRTCQLQQLNELVVGSRQLRISGAICACTVPARSLLVESS